MKKVIIALAILLAYNANAQRKKEKEKAESIFIEYYTDFLEALSSSYTENERAARLEYIYFRYVDPDPSEALRLFFRLHK